MKRFITCAVVALLWSCGDDDSSDSKSANKDFIGAWKSECIDGGDGSGNVQTLTFTDTEATFDTVVYNEATCVSAGLKMTIVAGYSITGDVAGIENAKAVTYTAKSAKVKPLSAEAATGLNSAALYGIINWESGVEKDVTGQKSTPDDEPIEAGKVSYDLLKLADNELSWGDNTSGDGKTEANRPKSLDVHKFKKQ